jgi:hypothetical protein
VLPWAVGLPAVLATNMAKSSTTHPFQASDGLMHRFCDEDILLVPIFCTQSCSPVVKQS